MSFNYTDFLQTYNQIEQRTDEWYSIRKTIITATDAGTILDYNRFSSKNDLLKKKLSDEDIKLDTPAINHGVFFEPIATKCYEELNNTKVHDVGLVIHPDLKWLGASPDGIMENGKLLEIKCLYSRQFKNTNADIPKQYWAQIQIQLEVCNVEECDLYQCIFKKIDRVEYNKFSGIKGKEKRDHWILKDYRCNTIKRDKEWFNNIKDKLYDFWLLVNREQNGLKITNRIKKIKNNLGIDNSWISVNMIKNWMLNDPLIDWLNMYGDKSLMDKKTDIKFNFQYNLQCKKVKLFESILYNLKDRFEVHTITEDKECSIDNYKKTIKAINKGYEIIYNGVLYDEINKIYGICDLIIRTDIIPLICNDYSFAQKNLDMKSQWYYNVVQFKYSTLNLNKNGFINKSDNSNYYKGECMLLQRILNNIQKMNLESYILGKYIKKDKEKYIGFKELGIIDVSNSKDNNISNEIDKALDWLKRLKDDGLNWNIKNSTQIELSPNMSNNSNEWTQYKKTLANEVNELTLLNGIGYDKKVELFNENIYTWNNKKIIDKYNNLDDLININLSSSKDIINIKDNNKFDFINSIDKTCLKLYVDFETINNYKINEDAFKNFKKSDDLEQLVNEELIYLIGTGWEQNGKWIFKKFMVNNITYDNEKTIINEWYDYINLIMKTEGFKRIELYHWTFAECRMLNNSCARHNISNKIKYCKWIDLHKLFKDNVYIKGAFDYSLKTVAKAMYKNKMINTKWEDEELNGLSTMIAIEYYNNMNIGLHNIKEVEEIIKYNEVDCKVMWEMINYL